MNTLTPLVLSLAISSPSLVTVAQRSELARGIQRQVYLCSEVTVDPRPYALTPFVFWCCDFCCAAPHACISLFLLYRPVTYVCVCVSVSVWVQHKLAVVLCDAIRDAVTGAPDAFPLVDRTVADVLQPLDMLLQYCADTKSDAVVKQVRVFPFLFVCLLVLISFCPP